VSDSFVEMFFHDGREQLDSLSRILGELSENFSAVRVNQAFRYAHSVKSEASFLEFGAVEKAAHVLEDELAALRQSGRRPSAEAMRVMKSHLAVLETEFDAAGAVAAGESGSMTGDGEDGSRGVAVVSAAGGRQMPQEEGEAAREAGKNAARSGNVAGRQEAPPRAGAVKLTPYLRHVLRESQDRGERLYRVRCYLTEDHQMLFPRLYLLTNNLEQVANVIQTDPRIQEPLPPVSRFEALVSAVCNETQLREAVDVDAVQRIEIIALSYDQVFRESQEDGFLSGLIEGAPTVQVEFGTRSYETLCLYTGELVYQLNQAVDELRTWAESAGPGSQALTRLELARRLCGEVDRVVRQSSTVPLSSIFEQLPGRAAHYATRMGKKIRVDIAGGGDQVFRPVAEVLMQALVHLVNNAVIHAIEPAAERIERGKPETGSVVVASEKRGKELSITVSDDGRGINREKIQRYANKLGIGKDDAPLLDILCAPGFTTRGDGKDVGRGVGLDAVRHQVENLLGGHLSVTTRGGSGTMFSISLPAATHLVSVMVAQRGERAFAMPSAHIRAAFGLEERFLRRDERGGPHYRYEGRNVRLYSVGEKAGDVQEYIGKTGLLIEVGGTKGIVVVDSVISQETVVRDPASRGRVFSEVLGHPVEFIIALHLLK